ncbi:unnamed protein product [Schistosoma mattheei]|uniref:Uncharacterized protein n=1 Tax=Schistosoma mattheei TaxID=31246 RepID=A0A183NPF4_9TREM|nr:unnamed protein product [Schistosoma mattheei]
MDHATPSTGQINTGCPVAVDTSDVFEMIMRPRHLTRSKFGGCNAMFRLRYTVNRFVISSSRMIHNHPCSEKRLKNDPWFRRLSGDQLKVVLPMVETGSSAESIVKYAEEDFEKTITVHYVNNLRYKFVGRKLIPYIYGFLGCGSLNDVIATLRNNGKLFVSYGGWLTRSQR